MALYLIAVAATEDPNAEERTSESLSSTRRSLLGCWGRASDFLMPWHPLDGKTATELSIAVPYGNDETAKE
jgi:hypothetical protein